MKPSAQLASVLGLFLVLLALSEWQFHWIQGWFSPGPLGQRELATRILGEYLAHQYPGKRAIILSNPFSIRTGQPPEIYRFEKAGVRGLQRGLGKSVSVKQIVYPEIRQDFFTHPKSIHIAPDTTTPLSYLLVPEAIDTLADQHPDAELLISLIGLPKNIRQSRTWMLSDMHKFALLLPDLRVVGEQEEIVRAVRSHKIAAFVLNRPGAPADDAPMGRDAKMEFEQRYVLITPENVEQVLRNYPRLF